MRLTYIMHAPFLPLPLSVFLLLSSLFQPSLSVPVPPVPLAESSIHALCVGQVVTTTAFEAWVCTPEFEAGYRFLVADVSVECNDPIVEMWASIALVPVRNQN